MNITENPLTDLSDCIAHAQYEGFSDIEYDTRDWDTYYASDKKIDTRITKTRRPTIRDFTVYNMFPQTWGSTSLGHGGMGGAAMTTAYTIVLYCRETAEFLVYFGGIPAYKVMVTGKTAEFVDDCKQGKLVHKKDAKEKYGKVLTFDQ